jgi:hypothetical protein
MDIKNLSRKEILDLVAYGLNAVKELNERGQIELAEATEANVCRMMDELYLRNN